MKHFLILLGPFTVAAPAEYQVRLEPIFNPTRLECTDLETNIHAMSKSFDVCNKGDVNRPKVYCTKLEHDLKLKTDLPSPVTFAERPMIFNAEETSQLATAWQTPEDELVIPILRFAAQPDVALLPRSNSDYERVLRAFSLKGPFELALMDHKLQLHNKLTACALLKGDVRLVGTVKPTASLPKSTTEKDVLRIRDLAEFLDLNLSFINAQKNAFAAGAIVGALVAEWHATNSPSPDLQYAFDLLDLSSDNEVRLKDVSSFFAALHLLKSPYEFSLKTIPYLQGAEK
ncbi:MAG: hypothetical protein AB7T49_05080 [Oligoflexales bacterium]